MSWPLATPKFLKAHSRGLKVHSGLFSCNPIPRSDTGEAWGDKVKQYSSICFQSCLQSHSCTFLLIPDYRDSLCSLDLCKPPTPESYQGSGLKHVSSEVCIELSSGSLNCEKKMQLYLRVQESKKKTIV